jgi:hypothetical protein
VRLFSLPVRLSRCAVLTKVLNSNDTTEYALWRNQLPVEMQAHSTLFVEVRLSFQTTFLPHSRANVSFSQTWGIHFNYFFPASVPWLSVRSLVLLVSI